MISIFLISCFDDGTREHRKATVVRGDPSNDDFVYTGDLKGNSEQFGEVEEKQVAE